MNEKLNSNILGPKLKDHIIDMTQEKKEMKALMK